MRRKKKLALSLAAAAVILTVIAVQTSLAGAVEGADWDELRSTVEAGGSYTLTGDIRAQYDGTINVAGTAEIDLAGHQLIVEGSRDSDTDLFSVTGTLKVKSTADSGTISSTSGRSVIGVNGGSVQLNRIYLHGYKTDHIVYNDDGSLHSEGGKLFGLTTGSGDGGGICLVNGALCEMPTGVISRLEGQYGGGVFVDEHSELVMGPDVLIENCCAQKEGGGIYWEYTDEEPAPAVSPRDCSAAAYDGIRLVYMGPWDKLKRAVNMNSVYTLQEDVTGREDESAAQIMIVTADGAGIDLNGHTLTIINRSALPVVQISESGSFRITDSKGTGTVLLQSSECLVENAGSCTMSGVRLQADEAVTTMLANHGSAKIEDTTIDGRNQTNNCIVNEPLTGNAVPPELEVSGSSRIESGSAKAGESPNGGGILNKGGSVVVSGTAVITDCRAAERGGAIFSEAAGGTVEVADHAVIQSCTAERGGAVCVDAGTVLLSGSAEITSCTGNRGGAVSVFEGARLEMAGQVEIHDCSASVSGGAVFSNGGGTVVLSDSAVIRGCTAAQEGGGIWIYNGTTVLGGSSSISDCSAEMHGGGIANTVMGQLDVQDQAQIVRCSAQNGGGLYTPGAAVFSGSASVADCTAEDYGGGIYIIGTVGLGKVTLCESASIESCQSKNRAGGVCNWHGTLEMQDEAGLLDCSAVSEGGGLFNNAGTCTLTGSSAVTDCHSGGHGGGIINWGDDGITNIGGSSRITGCTADRYGGGIANWNGTTSMTGSSTVTGCSAQSSGGIYVNNGTVRIYSPLAVSGNTPDNYSNGVIVG